MLLALSALSAAVWSFINLSGRGHSLRYTLTPSTPTLNKVPSGGEAKRLVVQPGATAACGREIAPPPQPPCHSPATSTPSDFANMQSTARPHAAVAPVLPGVFPGGVAILVPGRNEASHLPTTLRGLCEQDYGGYMVVFVDDASTDDTPRITGEMAERFPHLRVLRNAEEPPPGWMGKCHAIFKGYEALVKWEVGSAKREVQDADAAGTLTSHFALPTSHFDWLCFTDADIHWDPSLLRTALAYAEAHDADLLGLTPTLRFGSKLEAIVQLQLVLALGILFPFEKAMDPESPVALTGGAFILVRRSFYDQIGGHAAVRGEMVEDLKLGMALKAAGARHRVAIAGDLLWCRMYDGFADQWEGLTKNAYAGLEHRWYLALPMTLAVLLLNVLPPVYLALSVVWLVVSPGWMPAAAACFSLVSVLLIARSLNAARKLMHLPAGYAWTMTAGSFIYLLILLASMWQYHTGGNRWAGRTYGPA